MEWERLERALGAGLLLLAIVLASGIGLARIRWENAYHRVQLAVHLSDLVPSLTWGDLREWGVTAVVVSPREVLELRERYFGLRPGSPSLSLSLEELRAWTSYGLELYWDLDAWVRPASFSAYGEDLLRERPRGFVLSFPYALGPWGQDPGRARLLRGRGAEPWVFAVPEFGGFAQRDALIALYRSGCGCFVVRAHGLSREERERLSREERVGRYVRAVRERNVRLLLLRADSAEELRRDAEALSRRLPAAGFSLGGVPAPAPFEVPAGLRALLWLSAVGGLGLRFGRALFVRWVPGSGLLLPALAGVVALAGGIGLWAGGEFAQAAAAWGIAAAAPALGLGAACRRALVPPLSLKRAAEGLLLSAGISGLGGLLAAALLSSDLYFLKLEEPRGIKAALLLPLLLAAVGLLRRYRLRDFRPADAIAWGALLLAVGLALWRSGNVVSAPEWPLFPWERSFREALEGFFGVRPRFKEFLVGYPLLLLGFLLHGRARRPATAALLTLGAIGPISVVNTFLHLHTPLLLTLLRTLYGLGLGLLLGLGLGGCALRRLRSRRVD